MRELAGRVAVVTGAASGIGLALSRRLGLEGMRVMMADVDAPALTAAARLLEADGIDAAATVTDVSDPDSVEALAGATLGRFGAVHVVCNNAGVNCGGASWEIPLPMWHWVLGVNLFGIVHGIRSFLPHLIAQGEGHVVNTASVAGVIAPPWSGPYSASKHAAVAVSESLRGELAADGSPVGVSVLCPGAVRTGIAQARPGPPGGAGRAAADSPRVAEWRRASAAMVESGIDPAAVAAAVCEAIVSNRFWIFTHPEYTDAMLGRYRGAVEGRAPQPPRRRQGAGAVRPPSRVT
jgi:NAD(P)-dependent dehydrogenase (short-subunit alcohol dehydrogenase family)